MIYICISITILNAVVLGNQFSLWKEKAWSLIHSTWDYRQRKDLSLLRPLVRNIEPFAPPTPNWCRPALTTRRETSSVSCSDLHTGASHGSFEINELTASRSQKQQNHQFLIDFKEEEGRLCPLNSSPLLSLEDGCSPMKETWFPKAHKNALGSHCTLSFLNNDDKPLIKAWLCAQHWALFFIHIFIFHPHNSSMK